MLSLRTRRSDATSESLKAIVIVWWIFETRPSPNRKEVVKQWIALGSHEEYHAQYLLESHAQIFTYPFIPILCFSKNLYSLLELSMVWMCDFQFAVDL